MVFFPGVYNLIVSIYCIYYDRALLAKFKKVLLFIQSHKTAVINVLFIRLP